MSETSLPLLWGTEEIAKFIGRNDRQTFHLLATGQIPAKKVGGRWVASPAALERHLIGEQAE